MKTLIALSLMLISIADTPRKVLLFHHKSGEQQWKTQLQVLKAAQKGIEERDIEITSVPFLEQNTGKWRKWKIDSSDAFTFILIGRDGGEKLRSKEVVSSEKLFGLIDAMPMRRTEMKDSPKGTQ